MANAMQAGGEFFVHDSDYGKKFGIRTSADGDTLSVVRYEDDGDVETVIQIDRETGAVVFEDAPAFVGGVRSIADNGALVIGPTDRYIILEGSSDDQAKAATFPDAIEGQEVTLELEARSSTGSYTVEVGSDDLTLNAAGEIGTIWFDGTTWHAKALIGATVV